MTKRLLRLHEVINETGLSRSTIYALMAKGEFPKNIQLTERCVAWPESAVQTWIQDKIDACAPSERQEVA